MGPEADDRVKSVEQDGVNRSGQLSEMDTILQRLSAVLKLAAWSTGLLTAAVLLLAAVTFGELVNYYSFETGFVSLGFALATVVAFCAGWFARGLLARMLRR